jgi:ABC-2 type transport system permease protein
LVGLAIPLLSRPSFFILSLVYYLLGFLVYAVLMGSVGALGTSQQESQQLAGIFSFMAAIPLMLGGFVIANPNILIARILSWIPFTAPIMMMLRLPLGETPTIDIVISLISILVAIPLILWVGAKVFRLGLLMYGKRPSLRQVWRTLRQS